MLFRRFTNLNSSELSNLLNFLGRNHESIFDGIESPVNQSEGWSSNINGGRYAVKGMPKR